MSQALIALTFAVGCDPGLLELSVDVRTDLVAGTDFESVRVELEPMQGPAFEPATRPAAGADWVRGVRVADFAGLSPGAARVEVSLLDGAGQPVLRRSAEVGMESDYALTVVLSAACVGVTCPGGQPASHTECLSGECVEPSCAGPSPEGCGAIACGSPADCEGVLSCAALCLDGACVCAAQGSDGGVTPGCECAAGESQSDTRACGECGEGVEERTRTCADDCTWSEWSEWGSCVTDAECSPSDPPDEESRSCGNCDLGTQSRTRTCDSSTCRWVVDGEWGACEGDGACAPGETRTGCDPCGHEVCSDSCEWGECEPREAGGCLVIRPGTSGPEGNNFRCCGSGRWEFCLPSCVWSGTCEACSGCGC